jgi:endoglucanase
MKKLLAILSLCLLGLAIPSCSTTSTPTVYKGINLSGAESGGRYPGVEGTDYIFPTNSQIDYFHSKGMNTFRINFAWERLQPTAKGSLDPTHLAKLKALTTYATSKGGYVLLNPQNFARYNGKLVGSAEVPNDVFADFWRRVALEFKSNPKVMFGLVNEPNNMSTVQWRLAAQEAVTAIRFAGAENVITVPGNGWTGMHSWTQNWYDTATPKFSNSQEMIKIVDPKNNFIYEVHQYLDSDFSGGHVNNGDCVSATIGSEKAKPFVAWLRANNRKAILGEIGSMDTPLCRKAITDLLTYLKSNQDVMVGWLWWNTIKTGWWTNGGLPYRLDLGPKNNVDDPRMSWLSPFLVPDPVPTVTVSVPPPVDAAPEASAPVADAGTLVDAGKDSGVIVDAGKEASVPVDAGPAPTFTVVVRKTYDWTSGYCAEVDLVNNTKSTLSWTSTSIDLFDGTVRDENKDGTMDVWGGRFSARTSSVKVSPATWNKSVPVGKKGTFGMCVDRGASKKVVVVSGVTL